MASLTFCGRVDFRVTRAFLSFGGSAFRAEILATPPFSTLVITMVESESYRSSRVGGCGTRNVAGPSVARDSCFKMFGPRVVDPVESNPKRPCTRRSDVGRRSYGRMKS